VGIFAIPPNTTMYMMVVNAGCMKNHNGPRMVCLYWVTMSRLTNIDHRSRYCQISAKSTCRSLSLGLMTVVQVSSI